MVLLLKLSFTETQLIPSSLRLSPAKGGSAKAIPTQTGSIVVKGEPDADVLPETPIRVAAKSKGKRPQRYSSPIEISDSEGDATTPQEKPRKEEGSALRSHVLENMYAHHYSSFSSLLSSVVL